MTLLVVMSPCALVLSIPSAILAAIAWGARHGVLFRGGAAIEKLAEVDVVAMDKTGTLTEGELRVTKIESFPAGRESDVLRIAVSLESNSNHPIARAIMRFGQTQGIAAGKVGGISPSPGRAARPHEAGLSYVGRRELVQGSPLGDALAGVPDAPLGFSEVWVLHEQIVGRILLKDEVRPGSRGAGALAADGAHHHAHR
ncbi:MAG: cation-translocating P-type ATPase [Verrucomicrobiaceae bacterium]|nr:cation-translocating P-type ATPase [Verrucomicrobiaceae bacterium]